MAPVTRAALREVVSAALGPELLSGAKMRGLSLRPEAVEALARYLARVPPGRRVAQQAAALDAATTVLEQRGGAPS
jgi:hypothetical protein